MSGSSTVSARVLLLGFLELLEAIRVYEHARCLGCVIS